MGDLLLWINYIIDYLVKDITGHITDINNSIDDIIFAEEILGEVIDEMRRFFKIFLSSPPLQLFPSLFSRHKNKSNDFVYQEKDTEEINILLLFLVKLPKYFFPFLLRKSFLDIL